MMWKTVEELGGWGVNLLHLEYFCKLAENEHYVKTAEELFISQPTLSYAIANLEKELGCRLFEKKGRNVVITAKGQIFYEYVRQALHLIREGTEIVSAPERLPSETVHLGANRVWFLITVMHRLSLEEMSKSIKITYVQNDNLHIVKGLLQGEYAFGLLSSVVEDARLTYHPIRDLPFVLLTPRDHYFALRKSIDLREIGDAPVILRDASSSLRDASRELFTRAGILPNVVNEASSYELMAHLVSQGIGLGIAADTPSIRSMGVSRIPISYPKYDNVLYLATARERRLTQGQEYVCNYLLEHYSLAGQ